MTDDFSDKNLELCAEAFVRETVFLSIASSVAVLHTCEVHAAPGRLGCQPRRPPRRRHRQQRLQGAARVQAAIQAGPEQSSSLQTMAMSSALDFQRWLDVHGLLRGR
jgi:hypothetical protein